MFALVSRIFAKFVNMSKEVIIQRTLAQCCSEGRVLTSRREYKISDIV